MVDFKKIETISLDFYNNNIKTINVKQLDTKSRYIKIKCTEHGKFVKLNNNELSTIVRCKNADGFYTTKQCDILSDCTILLELTQQMLSVSGRCVVDIIIFYTNLISGGENSENYMHEVIASENNGNVSLSEESVYLNDITITDDNSGNVSIIIDEGSNFKIVNIEDIYKLNIPVLSTMLFYLNVIPSAIDHAKISSAYQHDDLIDVVGRAIALEEYIKGEMESATGQCEDAAIAVNEIVDNFNNEIKPKMNKATDSANDAAMDAQNIIDNYTNVVKPDIDGAIDIAENKAALANDAAQNAQDVIDNYNNVVKPDIDDAISDAHEAADKCQSVIDQGGIVLKTDIVHNLETNDENKVPDATQVKILNELISKLQKQIDEMPEIHYGVGEPTSDIGKDGDIYMMLIDENSEGGES